MIFSDNAKSFRAAAVTLRGSVQWCTIPERAAWWGGFWERLVKSVKDLLRKVLGTSLVSEEEFRTLLTEVEFVISNRPLTYISDDREDPVPLRPIDFMLTPGGLLEKDEEPARNQLLEERLRRSQLLEKAWRRWSRDYLHELRSWKKIRSPGHGHPTVGDIVLVDPLNTINRALFPLGRVKGLIPGRDGVVRAAFVRTGGLVLRRATKHLYPLEIAPPNEERGAQTDVPSNIAKLLPRDTNDDQRTSTSMQNVGSMRESPPVTRSGRQVRPPHRYGAPT
jgi:hypothetical protein